MQLSLPVTGVIAVIFAVTLAGCSWLGGDTGVFRDRSGDYRETPVTERIRIPEGIEAPAIEDLYAVPKASGSLQLAKVDKFEVPPPESNVALSQSDVRAFRSGNRYWISASGSPSEAWARVRRFWELNGIDLELEIPNQGVMETTWLSRNKDGVRTTDKFRIRVEHGMHEKSSEVYILHLGFPADSDIPAADALDWSTVEENDEVAKAIMQEIAGYFIETEYEGVPASLLAQSFVGSPKSIITQDENGNVILVLSLDYSRAWDSVGKAIDEERTMQPSDKDRSSGVYYINFFPDARDPDKGAGFFSFLGFGSEKKKLGKPQPYQIKLVDEGEHIVVQVSAEPGQKRDLSDAVLATIKDNLI
jgi:outer membrane protein assembly factor BamC